MSAVLPDEATVATEGSTSAENDVTATEAGGEGGAMAASGGAAPSGVLRKEGSTRRESKNVMFSDGIRPGGDLTELDPASDVPNLATRIVRRQKLHRGSRNSGSSYHLTSPPLFVWVSLNIVY